MVAGTNSMAKYLSKEETLNSKKLIASSKHLGSTMKGKQSGGGGGVGTG